MYAMLLAMPVIAMMTSCEPNAPKQKDLAIDENQLDSILRVENPQGYRIYNMDDFLDAFMTEEGNFLSDTTPYRTRSTKDNKFYLYAVDTIKTDTIGIYLRGRVCTDDYGGNFYKALVIQQVTDWNTGAEIDQQCLRISVDMGSVNGLYPMGQEILIRCNGLSVGRYANQPQLCVPAYNNNIYAINNTQKVGWGPGRIPAARFRKATKRIGWPDASKLKVDEYKLSELFNLIPRKIDYDRVSDAQKAEFMKQVRYADGRLVRIRRVCFTGYTNNDGDIAKCIYHDPTPPYKDDSASLANVFAPTTNNIGYPPNRILCDANDTYVPGDLKDTLSLSCSNSEYSKFSNFFLPGAKDDFKDAVTYCPYYQGKVTGILGWYCDNATGTKNGNLSKLTGQEWSVTPRGILGYGVNDIDMNYNGIPWVPQEFDPKVYKEKKSAQQ